MNLIFLIKYKLGYYPKITNNEQIVRKLFWLFPITNYLHKMSRFVDGDLKLKLKDEINNDFSFLFNFYSLIFSEVTIF